MRQFQKDIHNLFKTFEAKKEKYSHLFDKKKWEKFIAEIRSRLSVNDGASVNAIHEQLGESQGHQFFIAEEMSRFFEMLGGTTTTAMASGCEILGHSVQGKKYRKLMQKLKISKISVFFSVRRSQALWSRGE